MQTWQLKLYKNWEKKKKEKEDNFDFVNVRLFPSKIILNVLIALIIEYQSAFKFS